MKNLRKTQGGTSYSDITGISKSAIRGRVFNNKQFLRLKCLISTVKSKESEIINIFNQLSKLSFLSTVESESHATLADNLIGSSIPQTINITVIISMLQYQFRSLLYSKRLKWLFQSRL